ncbi:MAG: hypothetical protein KatS3mg077_1942 [Candidatus Binatia bacterium]|nr:MAG: hypothetical protein KatS3mg077_1942 [Candidatus Binatia bacterium]
MIHKSHLFLGVHEVDETGATLARSQRGARAGAAVVLFALVLAAPSPGGASFGPFGWVYKTCHGDFADTMGSAFGMLFGLPVAGVCGLVLLPADVAHEVRHPEDQFMYYSREVCVYPTFVVTGAVYLVSGAPFYAAQLLFWDAAQGPCPPAPPKAPEPPGVEPAGTDPDSDAPGAR